MFITQQEARVHNLVMRLFKYRDSHGPFESLAAGQLRNEMGFRERDFRLIVDQGVFVKEDDSYRPTRKLAEALKKLEKRKNEIDAGKCIQLEKEYVAGFEELKLKGNYRYSRDLVVLATEVHWCRLPEYEEDMIVNREVYPNEATQEYYDHYHALEDLYKALTGAEKDVASRKGDINLEREMEIQIYSRRWGHYDQYRIYRTLSGWRVEFMHTWDAGKDGEALIANLEHDSINYPKSLGMYMTQLWELADNTETSVEKLGEHLRAIAEWINICETNTPEGIGL